MSNLSRWLAPLVIAAGFGSLALAPTTARADSGDELIRVLVDVADVVLLGDQPYYRNGNYGYDNRLTVLRDRHGQPRYYRDVPRSGYVNDYGRAPVYRGHDDREVKCNKHGKCKVKTQTTYYDPRYDRDRYGKRRYRYDDD